MKTESLAQTVVRQAQSKPLLVLGAAAAVILLLVWLFGASGGGGATTDFHIVQIATNFPVTIVEGGNLAAVNETVIRSEVEGTSRIIYIVPEGTYVTNGQLIVELDSSSAQDQLNQQLINYEKATNTLVQARAQLAIQQSLVESEIRAAQLKVRFAEIDLERYLKGQALMDRQQAEMEITNILANLQIAEETAEWSDKLYDQGFETKRTRDTDRLKVLTTSLSLDRATNSLWMIETFDYAKMTNQLYSDLLEAQKELERVIAQGESKIAQYKADVVAQQNTLDLNRSKLERDQRQLEATKVYAPQDGLVVYSVSEGRFSSESLIEEGAVIRNRQEIIKLPDTARMKLTVKVHESHINLVRQGQLALVTLDAMPDQVFRGVVARVGLLPDTQSRWGNPNLKVYNTDILITDPLPDVKPGGSARAEIVVTNITDALTVPLQAVTTKRGRQVVYVDRGGETEPAPVEVGPFNTKFIQIVKGLSPGDRVLLSPPFDTEEQDLGGAVLAASEIPSALGQAATLPALPPPTTNNNAPGPAWAQPQSPIAATPGTQPLGVPTGERPAFPGREEMMKRFDANGDGELDEQEREAMRTEFATRFGGGGPGGGMRAPDPEMIKRFDTNGDGQLDEQEREAMRTEFRSRSGGQGGGRRGESGAGRPTRPPEAGAGEGGSPSP